jgi:hypothetical protein
MKPKRKKKPTKRNLLAQDEQPACVMAAVCSSVACAARTDRITSKSELIDFSGAPEGTRTASPWHFRIDQEERA